MAVIASDTFGGLGDGTSLGGRTLDNGAGGSGTRAWASIASANLVGNGSGQVRGTSNARNNRVQIAGLVARRIVCWTDPGADLAAGERFGLIRFGSRVDVYLPQGAVAKVARGQTATAGETVIAEFGPQALSAPVRTS